MFERAMKLAMKIVAAICLSTAVAAEDMAAPTGDAVLTLSGNLSVTNVNEFLVFDREALFALGGYKFETSTIWTDGVHSFEGVSLETLVGLIGAEEGTLLATAINDYTIEIPVTDAVEGGPMIAYLMDGEEMSIRDKGPLWVIYPYDSSFEYRTEVVYARSIWQLDRIEVVE